jgi:2',3'-cyclic-nucleotide 2'-phosphodiesterase (5'-nucleotidase family)
LADSLKHLLKTEIGIINSGVLNCGVRKGAVTKKLLHKMCPSPLNPTYVELRGIDLYTALEKSLQQEYPLKDGGGPGFRGKYLGSIQVSHNVHVKLDASEKRSPRIESVTVDGKPLELDRWYTVGTSDYLQRGTGYSELANNRNPRYRPEFLREVLEVYLKNQLFLKRALSRRFMMEKPERNTAGKGNRLRQ